MTAHELGVSADLALTAVRDCDEIASRDYCSDDLNGLMDAYLVLLDVVREATGVRDALASKIGSLMSDKRQTIGAVTVERHRIPPRRSEWDHDGLLRMVVDSRVVNAETGEIESTLDVLKKVYPLKGYNARFTALRDLGIDCDEFSRKEWRDGFTLRIHGGDK